MEKSEFATEMLKQYAKENCVITRSTSDLSPLEEWLIVKLYEEARVGEISKQENIAPTH